MLEVGEVTGHLPRNPTARSIGGGGSGSSAAAQSNKSNKSYNVSRYELQTAPTSALSQPLHPSITPVRKPPLPRSLSRLRHATCLGFVSNSSNGGVAQAEAAVAAHERPTARRRLKQPR